MLTSLLAVNLLCLGAALLLLRRLVRPVAPEGSPEPFARILAETAALVRVPPEADRTLSLQHGHREDATC